MRHTSNIFIDNRGFTLIETIIVVVVLSIMALAVTPRLTTFFSSERENMAILTGIITKTFDDSFLNSHTNLLAIHLHSAGDEFSDSDDTHVREIFSRTNGLSVLKLEEGKFIENDKKMLQYRGFPDSFMIEEVLFSNGEISRNGTKLVAFYPQGYSDNIIIHILVNNEDRWSVILHKYLKEPVVVKEYKSFEDDEAL